MASFLRNIVCLALFTTLMNSSGFAQNKENPDVLFKELGKCQSSIDSLDVLLRISDALFDRDPEYCLEITDFTQRLAKRIGDTKSLIKSSNKLAMIQQDLGFMNLARKTINDNIALSEERGDEEAKGQTKLISGHIQFELEEYATARAEYQSSLNHYKSASDTAGMAHAYLGLGSVGSAQGNESIALSYYEKAEEIWSHDNPATRAELWTKMGGTYTQLGQYKQAEKFLNKSLAYYQKNGEASGQAEVSFNLGELYMKMGKSFESEAAFIDCVDLGKRRNHPEDVLLGYDGVYRLKKSEGKHQQALIYLEKYMDLKEKMESDELEVKEGLEKYYIQDSNLAGLPYHQSQDSAASKAENQMLWIVAIIAILLLVLLFVFYVNIRKKNRILQSQKESIESKNDEIDVSLKEKDLLLKEVHHRVKNNLQIISSLLNLQRHKITDEATLEVLGESINRIQSISLIHQKFYQSSNLAKVDFKNYLTDLMESQKRLYGNPDKPVRTMVIGKAHFVSLDTAVPLGLIIAELITNAFKHAFASQPNPELVIRIEAGEYLTITVKDNGQGLPRGFSVKNSNSLGMEIVEALSEQLFGHVSYRNEEGAVFVVRVKEISQPT